MSGIAVVKAYLVSYPRLTLAFIALVVGMVAIAFWHFGPIAVAYGVAIYFLLTLMFKFMLLLWFHPKLFDYPRRVLPVLLSMLLFGGTGAALQFPLYRQMCAIDPAALAQTHLCAEFPA